MAQYLLYMYVLSGESRSRLQNGMQLCFDAELLVSQRSARL